MFDLPDELWAEIVTYLPKGTLPKMIGVNRFLFEVGMNELYQEIRLSGSTWIVSAKRTFERIQHRDIASRVHRVYVCSDFLPFTVKREEPPLRRSVAYFGKWFGNSRRLNRRATSREEGELQVLTTAMEGLFACPHLEEVVIEVTAASPATPAFSDFLTDLVQEIGPKIRLLTLKIEIGNWRLQKPMPSTLSCLTVLNINLTRTSFVGASQEDANLCLAHMRTVLMITKATLTNLTVSTCQFLPDIPDISGLFHADMGPFPSLRTVQLQFSVHSMNLSHPEYFTRYLQDSAFNLEHLLLVPEGSFQWDWSASLWMYTNFTSELVKLRASHLQELQVLIRPRELFRLSDGFAKGFCPNLRKLTIISLGDFSFDYDEFSYLVDKLSRGECEHSLEALNLRVALLSPKHFDILYTRLPTLQTLRLEYWYLSTDPNTRVREKEEIVYEAFRENIHPDWQLKELVLVELGFDPAFEGFPDRKLREMIIHGRTQF